MSEQERTAYLFSSMKRSTQSCAGFTLIELLTVMVIIGILAGLSLATMQYAFYTAGVKRAASEINALSAGLESYKIDNGDYPRTLAGTTDTIPYTNLLDARVSKKASAYTKQSLVLYTALSGDSTQTRTIADGTRVYFEFRPNMLFPKDPKLPVKYLIDPWGKAYGYSTIGSANTTVGTVALHQGYNPTFDLWSTCDDKDDVQWKKNW